MRKNKKKTLLYVTPFLIKLSDSTYGRPSSRIILKMCCFDESLCIIYSKQNQSVRQSALRFRQRPWSSQRCRPIEYHCNQQQEPDIVVERSFQPKEGIDAHRIDCLPTDQIKSLTPLAQNLQFSNGQHNSSRQHSSIPLDNANGDPKQHLRILPRPSHSSKPRTVLQDFEQQLRPPHL